jgi:hypothetical protein
MSKRVNKDTAGAKPKAAPLLRKKIVHEIVVPPLAMRPRNASYMVRDNEEKVFVSVPQLLLHQPLAEQYSKPFFMIEIDPNQEAILSRSSLREAFRLARIEKSKNLAEDVEKYIFGPDETLGD